MLFCLIFLLLLIIIIAATAGGSESTTILSTFALREENDPLILALQRGIDVDIERFIEMLNTRPYFDKFKRYLDQSERNMQDDWDNRIYGGPVLTPITTKHGTKIRNSLEGDIANIKQDLKNKVFPTATYVIIKNVII